MFARGDHSVIDIHCRATPLDNDYSMNIADICPVGALTTKDFRFKIRVWFLEDAPGVCTGCSNGCNVHLGRREQQGLPLRAAPQRRGERDLDLRRGPALATSASARPTGVDRALGARRRAASRPTRRSARRRSRGAAAPRARRRTGAGAMAGVASRPRLQRGPRRAARPARAGSARAGCVAGADGPRGRPPDQGREGRQRGRRARARLRRPGAARGAASAPAPSARLVVLGHDLVGPGLLEEAGALAGLDTLIVLDTHHSGLERVAHVVFPVRHPAERDGTLTNHAGRVQRVEPAVEPRVRGLLRGRDPRRARSGARAPGLRRRLRRAGGGRELGPSCRPSPASTWTRWGRRAPRSARRRRRPAPPRRRAPRCWWRSSSRCSSSSS